MTAFWSLVAGAVVQVTFLSVVTLINWLLFLRHLPLHLFLYFVLHYPPLPAQLSQYIVIISCFFQPLELLKHLLCKRALQGKPGSTGHYPCLGSYYVMHRLLWNLNNMANIKGAYHWINVYKYKQYCIFCSLLFFQNWFINYYSILFALQFFLISNFVSCSLILYTSSFT